MRKLLAAIAVSAFALAHSPAFAQEQKSEPTKEEAQKAAGHKDEVNKTAPKKVEAKRKVKKGGC
ncbi:MAG: hypothetical protein M3Q28_03135 [Pseudomonadota bacterium]|nr:hypothetical protein [Burkholderiaceae bacterium]MDQ3187883.1 hypothetical protein [Pseudomonadota bacterium]